MLEAIIFCKEFRAVREEWNRRYAEAGLNPTPAQCAEIDAWFYEQKRKHLDSCEKCKEEKWTKN